MAIFKIVNADEFEKVKTIVEDNIQNGNKNYSIKGNSIVSNGDTFVLVDSNDLEGNSNKRESKSKAEKFTRFEGFNRQEGQKAKSTQTWTSVVSDNISFFYKNNDYLVYAPIDTVSREEDDLRIIKQCFDILAKDVLNKIKIEESQNDRQNYIYEVAVKFRFLFSGEPQYVLSKFYFNQDFELLSASKHQNMYNQVNAVAKQKKSSINATAEKVESLSVVQMNTISSKILDVMQNENGFQDYLVGDARDKFLQYKTSIIQSGQKEGEIKCDRIMLRYVANIKVKNKVYFVKNIFTNENLFEFTIDSNGNINASCCQCGKDVILSNTVTAFDKTGIEHTVEVSDVDNGDYDIDSNEFRKHCQSLSLGNCLNCQRLVCSNKLTTCEKCGDTLCIDCPNDDIVIYDVHDNGVSFYHKSCTTFCSDKMQYLPNRKTKVCQCCNRTFSIDAYDNNSIYCSLCEPIMNNSKDLIYRKLYKKHSDLLSISSRKRNSICNEDFEKIIIRTNTHNKEKQKTFIFDKSNAMNNKSITLTKLTKKEAQDDNKK